MTTIDQVESFHQFALRQLEAGFDDSIDDLYELWQSENLSPEELAESVAVVRAALADMEAGDTGVPMEEHFAQLRAQFNIPDEP